MRRLTLALVALLAAACASGAVVVPPDDASATPNPFGMTFVVPTREPTPDITIVPADTSTWLEIAPVGQGFAVAVPGQASVRSGTAGDPPAPTTFWTYRDQNGRLFQIARTRTPLDSLPKDPATLLKKLEAMARGGLDGSSLVSRTEATVDGRSGISFLARSGTLRCQGLLIRDGDVLYRVSMTFEVDAVDEADLTAFLGSFTLTA